MTAELKEKSPVWKQIYDNLLLEFPSFAFDQRFYTITEICAKFGVSHMTARKVLEELSQAGLVEKIQKRGTVVRNVAQKVKIRLLIQDKNIGEKYPANPLFLKIYDGIISELGEKTDFAVLSEEHLPALLEHNGANVGFLVMEELEEKNLRLLSEKSVPVVFVHTHSSVKGTCCVRPDFKKAAYLAVNHLSSLGHTRIAFLTGPITLPWFFPRFKGYTKALKKAGIRFDWTLIKESMEIHSYGVEEAMRSLMNLPSPPTALFASSDRVALHLLDYCYRNHLDVPGDVSIAGLDNLYISTYSKPPLTTVETHQEKIGRESVRMLLKILAGSLKTPKDIVIAPELIVRQSTQKPAAGKKT